MEVNEQNMRAQRTVTLCNSMMKWRVALVVSGVQRTLVLEQEHNHGH